MCGSWWTLNDKRRMDLNVCSRRVHDGYATIRSRPRNRPRAVYRSDSEELLKETGGPYALPLVSNVHLTSEQIHPRWSDIGKNKLSENYGTLRRTPKKTNDPINLKIEKKIILNTFVSQKHKEAIKNLKDKHYDDVPTVNKPEIIKTFLDKTTNQRQIDNNTLIKTSDVEENYYDTVTEESPKNKLYKEKKINQVKVRQPIYATPNIPRIKDNTTNDSQLITDGNYVPTGDLYRSTAKYIEDINRNIAEIDKSYEEFSYTSSRNSGYGIINRIPKSETSEHDDSLYRLRRKRNMAPMPPISSDFGGENSDDKNTQQNPNDVQNLSSRTRPNSYGKLPPKLLPRSSSIENTSRHSTGSTSTTTSSTKSTESLYAISESLTNLPRHKVILKSPRITKRIISSSSQATGEFPLIQDTLSNGTIRRHRCGVESTTLQRRDIVAAVNRGHNVDPEINSDDENRHGRRPRVTAILRRSRSRVEDMRKSPQGLPNTIESKNHHCTRRYDTLPYRRTKVSPRSLHKSSEDVLDGDKSPPSLQRTCASTIDIRNHEIKNNDRVTDNQVYLMDATDVILQAEKLRISSSSLQQTESMPNRFFSLTRTRHNSLESEDECPGNMTTGVYTGGFATLPRRGNISSSPSTSPKDQATRRLSGTVPVLEPLYEHAVSNPVKPRGNENVIPWWELATRKYRHRSCPSLQVNCYLIPLYGLWSNIFFFLNYIFL